MTNNTFFLISQKKTRNNVHNIIRALEIINTNRFYSTVFINITIMIYLYKSQIQWITK